MSVFIIVSQTESAPTLQTAIKEKYPNDHYELHSNQWLVSAGETAQEISDKLGITAATIVFSVSSYWGRSNPNVWEWLKVKWEKS